MTRAIDLSIYFQYTDDKCNKYKNKQCCNTSSLRKKLGAMGPYFKIRDYSGQKNCINSSWIQSSYPELTGSNVVIIS